LHLRDENQKKKNIIWVQLNGVPYFKICSCLIQDILAALQSVLAKLHNTQDSQSASELAEVHHL